MKGEREMLEPALKEQLKGIFAGLETLPLIYPYQPVMKAVPNCWNC
jgi:hypothetical protein